MPLNFHPVVIRAWAVFAQVVGPAEGRVFRQISGKRAGGASRSCLSFLISGGNAPASFFSSRSRLPS